ncbi:MAG TPA: ABC transporter permease [Acidobacteriota bacterium]|nr:ABC transporter permease [Acidobacteriota bacterium]HRR25908.1 ABC transporter permease [Acidobacteriota bacterium]HRV07968.1 ABC transporter permease [Acidobacteriota bacterium]
MNFLYRSLYEIQEFTLLSVQAVANLFRRPRYFQDTWQQMDAVGVASTVIIVLTGFFTGGVLALQTSKTLRAFGAVNVTGQLVALSLLRELGPVLTALMVAGRVGSGIASELGSMVVTEQVDAMRALGTDPVKKLVTPRMIACTTMVPLLTVVADLFGLIGGWLVALFTLRLNTHLYWSSAMRSLDYMDLVEGLTKPFAFGFIVGMIGSYFGLRTTGGTRGVGRSTTQAVVFASVLVIITDFFLSKIILELRP